MRRIVWIAVLMVAGCGPERGVEVEDWMLRTYSSVAPGILGLSYPHICRMEFRDDFTMEFVFLYRPDDEEAWVYDWEPTSSSSVQITPHEDSDNVYDGYMLGEATASPYLDPPGREVFEGSLEIEDANGIVYLYYPGAMCLEPVMVDPESECTGHCGPHWKAYPCDEGR